MIDQEIVDEAIELTSDGFTQRDLHKYLFVERDAFLAWVSQGRDLVNSGFGRISNDDLKSSDEVDEFDMLCLSLYKGITNETKKIRREMHRLVAQSDNPNMAFNYLKSVYAEIYDPKYAESKEDEENTETASSFVLGNLYANSDPDATEHAPTEPETS